MPRKSTRWFWQHLGALLFLVGLSTAGAVETLNINLDPLIDSAAHDSNRFAIDIPQAVSSTTQGHWSQSGSTRTWTYGARIAGAVSMSFHASHLSLPPSAELTVKVGTNSTTYHTKDSSRGGLWSRPLPGDTLTLTLSISTAEASQAEVLIDSLQAGYRGLGGGVADHPHYQRIMRAQATTASCTQNYSCNATAANAGPAQATVALLIANQYQCTGTLLNNTRNDGTPYILTARHCQAGKLGGGDPSAAASIVVYWDAVTACGNALDSIYYDTVTQSGATTIVEQQDAWLIKLDAPPVANDAYYAGWDASGTAFNGGYSIHHAMGDDKQYVGWYGAALLEHISASTLQVGYNSTFWGVINQSGNVGAGSSGGPLFDPNNHVVGSGTLADLVDGTGSAGVCPATPLVAPTTSNVAAQYTALADVWTSTADNTSTTGGVTLQSVLDPDNTSGTTLQGFGLTPITLSVDQSGPTIGDVVTLSWNVAAATSCTATGGSYGDGWAGTYSGTGSIQVTNLSPGNVNYALTCMIGNMQGHGSVDVYWNFIPAITGLVGPAVPVMVGGSFAVGWAADVTPCVATGGVTGDGWAGSKSAYGLQSIPANQLGTLTYSLNCGSGARAASSTVTVYVVPPYVTLASNATKIRVGEVVTLSWNGGGAAGGQCVAGGGSTTDGWNTGSTPDPSSGNATLTETTPGTYTYTLACSGGGQTASASTTVEFVADTPAISISALSAQQQVYSTPIAGQNGTPDLLWSSNVGGCVLSANGPTGARAVTLEGQYPSGSAADVVYVPGLYTYALQCGALQASTTINWVTTAPTGILTASATRWVANSPYTLTWSTNAGPCTATDGNPGDGWAGAKDLSGTQTLSESAQGTYLFTLTCGSVQSQVAVIIAAPSVTLTAPPSYLTFGGTTTLSWNSTLAPCTYLDGSQGSAAAPTPVSAVGSSSSTPATWGVYLYTVTCGTGSQSVQATTQVDIQPQTTLTANATTAPVNTPVTLTWTSPGSLVCIPTGGASEDATWQGALGGSGTATVTASSAGNTVYQINCNNGTAAVAVSYTAAVTTASSPPTVTTQDPPTTGSSATPSADTSTGTGGAGALDPVLLLLLSIPVALRSAYSSSRPLVTGTRAARTAGNKPPTNPKTNAHFRPFTNNRGETLKANTT